MNSDFPLGMSEENSLFFSHQKQSMPFCKMFLYQASVYGCGCWATSRQMNKVGVACCTSGLNYLVC